jgi:hypothetical protein
MSKVKLITKYLKKGQRKNLILNSLSGSQSSLPRLKRRTRVSQEELSDIYDTMHASR